MSELPMSEETHVRIQALIDENNRLRRELEALRGLAGYIRSQVVARAGEG